MLKRILTSFILCLCIFITKSYGSDTSSVCVGQTITPPPCADSFLTAYPGGTWSSSDPTIATVDPFTGVVTGIRAGTVNITYTYTNSCGTFIFVYTITVNPLPEDISGPSHVCVGSSITLTSSPSGGTWSSSAPAIASVIAGSLPGTGIVTGVSPGTATITYTLATGCYTTKTVTVDSTPTISGGFVCGGSTITITADVTGGTWSSSAPTIASVVAGSLPATGIVTGVSTGTAIITYMVGACFDTALVTVSAPTIAGRDSVCLDDTIRLTGSPSGGTWSSSNTAVATVGSASGVVTGVSAGTAVITYMLSNGCYKTKTIYVGAPFTINICEIAPIEICDSIVSYCSGLVLKVSGAPAGASYSWNGTIPATRSSSGADAIFTFTAAPTSGIYTVTATYGGCKAVATIHIYVVAGSCPPCDRFKPCSGDCAVAPFITILSNKLTSSNISTTVAKNYFIADRGGSSAKVDTIMVNPAPGSVFLIDSGMKLHVRAVDSVTLDSVHLFSSHDCPWAGITVRVTSTAAGKLKLINNTLIENVVVAGTISSGAVTIHENSSELGASSLPAGGGDIIHSEKAIFNQNRCGIYIFSFSNQTVMPFFIQKTVFTNRDFCSYQTGEGCNNHYPFVWPTADYLKTQTGSSTDYDPAFNVSNYTWMPSNANATSKYGGGYGLYLNQVGKTVMSTSTTPTSYYSMTIGSATDSNATNLFDTLVNGIVATGTNLVLYNNVFRGSQSTSGKGVQIVQNYGSGIGYTFQLLNGSTNNTHNRLYNCYNGVDCAQCYDFVSHNSVISATNRYDPGTSSSVPTPTNSATYCDIGLKLANTAYDMQDIRNNIISNVVKACNIVMSSGNLYCNNGDINVKNNTVTGITGTTTYEYADQGIYFIDQSTCTSSSGNIYIRNNNVTGYITGIISGAKNHTVHIDSNVVEIRDGSHHTPLSRAGIIVSNSNNNIANKRTESVSFNHVYGNASFGTNYKTPVTSVDGTSGIIGGYRGIQFERCGSATMNTTVSCNFVHDLNIGFNFLDTSYLVWKTNVMTRHKYGMLLQLSRSGSTTYMGRIGNQGSACSPSDNLWADDGSGATGWPGWIGATSSDTTWQTFTNGEDPAAQTSKIYARNVTGYMPTQNGTRNNGSFSGVAYTLGTSILNSSALCSPDSLAALDTCAPDGGTGGAYAPIHSSGGTIKGLTSIDFAANQFSVFPNPSDGNIVITQSIITDATADVMVTDYAGAKIYSGPLEFKNGRSNFKLGNVTPGIYMLHVKESNGSGQVFKLVIQK